MVIVLAEGSTYLNSLDGMTYQPYYKAKENGQKKNDETNTET